MKRRRTTEAAPRRTSQRVQSKRKRAEDEKNAIIEDSNKRIKLTTTKHLLLQNRLINLSSDPLTESYNNIFDINKIPSQDIEATTTTSTSSLVTPWSIVQHSKWELGPPANSTLKSQKQGKKKPLQKTGGQFLYDFPPINGRCYIHELPDEVLLKIFEYFYGDSRTISRAFLVCSQWYQLLSDHKLWDSFLLDIRANPKIPRKFLIKIHHTKRYQSRQYYSLFNASGKELGSLLLKTSADSFFQNYLALKAPDDPNPMPKHYKLENDFANRDLWSFSLLPGEAGTVVSFVKLNTKYICEVASKHPNGAYLLKESDSLLVRSFAFSETKEFDKVMSHEILPQWLRSHKNSLPTPEISDKLNDLYKNYLNTKLFHGQIETMVFFLEMENRISRGLGFEILNLAPLNISPKNQFYFDVASEDKIYPKSYINRYHYATLFCRGGIFADDVGLGKTLSILALTFLQKPEIPKLRERYQYLGDYSFSRLFSNATLVLCPSHLVHQWKSEISKHFKDSRKTGSRFIFLSTFHNLKKISYADFMNADVIVCSFTVICHADYQKIPPLKEKPDSKILDTRRCPKLNYFTYVRVVVDEAHEIIHQSYTKERQRPEVDILAEINNLHSVFRWFMSGTPFPENGASLAPILNFLQLEIQKPRKNCDENLQPTEQEKETDNKELQKGEEKTMDIVTFDTPMTGLQRDLVIETILDLIMVRHKKLSLDSGTSLLPEIREVNLILYLEPIESTTIETLIHERRPVSDLKKVVANFSLGFEDLIALLEDYKRIRAHRLKTLTQNIKEYERQLAWAKEQIRILTQLKKTTALNMVEAHKFKMCRRSIQSDEEKLDSLIPERDLSLTSNQILAKVDTNDQKKRFKKLEIAENKYRWTVKNGNEEENDKINQEYFQFPTTEDFRRTIWKYGTKTPFLLHLLKGILEQSQDNKIILFSQWTEYLSFIEQLLLEEFNIKSIFCSGSVFKKKNALLKFQEKDTQKETESCDPRILLLSSEQMASGSNLIEATHVVLVEPASGTDERATAVEAQAIGRAHRIGQTNTIEVIRLLVDGGCYVETND